jgi:hypothetical protein
VGKERVAYPCSRRLESTVDAIKGAKYTPKQVLFRWTNMSLLSETQSVGSNVGSLHFTLPLNRYHSLALFSNPLKMARCRIPGAEVENGIRYGKGALFTSWQ